MTALETAAEADPDGSGAGAPPPDRRRLLAVLAPTMALALAVLLHGVTEPGGVPPSPLAAANDDRTSRAAADLPAPAPLRRPSGPFVRDDPKGPLFTASGKAVRRLAPVRRDRRVALVFDDGPGAHTETVVRELREMGARATFFLVGEEVARRPRQVRVLRDAGMELGNHSWSHRRMSGLPPRHQRREIALGRWAIARAAGVRPHLFRPPQLAWDAATARAAADERQLGVLHTIETRDWALPGPAAIARAARNAEPGDIVALHDAGGDRTQTVAAARPIVAELRQRGIQCVTVSELLGHPDSTASAVGRTRGVHGELAVPPS